MDGRHAELHPALLASGKGFGQKASVHGQGLHHFTVVAQGVRAVDLSLEEARRAVSRDAPAAKQ